MFGSRIQDRGFGLRQKRIDGLRELVDYLEARPDIPLPYVGTMDAFGDPAELPVIARAMGGFTKNHDGNYLTLVRSFGPVQLHVNFASEAVCERVVVGTEEVPEKVTPAHVEEIVEWRCPESVLAFGGMD